MRIYLLIPCLILSACDKHPSSDTTGPVDVFAYEFLSPKDLNIEKMRFTATPTPNEVAIFRSSHRSATDRFNHTTYDQIMWTNGEETHKDVIIAPRSFYLDFPDPEVKTAENIFRDSWRLHAGHYRYDINDYGFVSSNWTSSNTEATGEVIYTKNNKENTEDLKFMFRMFAVSLEEAKRIHPELNTDRDEGTTNWTAAYRVVDETGDAADDEANSTP